MVFPQYLPQHRCPGLWKWKVQNISNIQTSPFLCRCFLPVSPNDQAKGVSLWILSPGPFERAVGSSYISQRCFVAASTLMFKAEKEFQTSFCLTLPSVAGAELLFVVTLSLGAQPSIMHRKQTCLSTAGSTARRESLTSRPRTANMSICLIWTMPLKCPENKQWWNRMNLWTSLTVAKSKSESRNARHIGKLAQTHCCICECSFSIWSCLFIPSVGQILWYIISCSVHWMEPHG